MSCDGGRKCAPSLDSKLDDCRNACERQHNCNARTLAMTINKFNNHCNMLQRPHNGNAMTILTTTTPSTITANMLDNELTMLMVTMMMRPQRHRRTHATSY